MTSQSPDLSAVVERWLETRGRRPDRVTPLAGDVSPRRYFRLRLDGARSAIAAFYPEALRDAGERFRRTGELLSAQGVAVPRILDWDPAAGLMLLSDGGTLAVHDAVASGKDPEPFWRQALAILERVTRLDPDLVAELNPRLDATLLRRELVQSWDLVLEPRGLVGDHDLEEDFRLALFEMCDRLGQAPARPCHRDFMARNLLIDDSGNLVVIDHQDLRLGPPWYDLASLLNDTLYASAEQEVALLDLARVPRPEREMYHRAAAQRALKIVGTFASFANRGVDRHLPLVAPSLAAARRHLERLPETAPVMRDLRRPWRAFSPPVA
jgi:aminoglycoside/choline kinase family phosphotransferase